MIKKIVAAVEKLAVSVKKVDAAVQKKTRQSKVKKLY